MLNRTARAARFSFSSSVVGAWFHVCCLASAFRRAHSSFRRSTASGDRSARLEGPQPPGAGARPAPTGRVDAWSTSGQSSCFDSSRRRSLAAAIVAPKRSARLSLFSASWGGG